MNSAFKKHSPIFVRNLPQSLFKFQSDYRKSTINFREASVKVWSNLNKWNLQRLVTDGFSEVSQRNDSTWECQFCFDPDS